MKSSSLYNKVFLLFITTTLISVSIIGWYGLQSTSKAYIDAAYEASYQNSSSIETAIESRLEHVPKDVLFATDFYALKRFLIWRSMGEENKAKKWKQIFSDALIDFLATKKDYYQARVIDINGQEIIHAQYIAKQGTTLLVKESALQNKKGRDYVEKTKSLKQGEFHISSMNLNVEHGKIENPYIPVLRYSTPIMGVNGKVVALFVVNTYAKSILDIVENQMHLDESKGISYYLINKDGDYLYHSKKIKRWNQQLNNGYNFNTEHFRVNKFLSKNEHGSFSKNAKIYSYHEVQAFSKYPDNYWYIVSSVDESIALSKLDEFKSMFLIVILLVTLISFFVVRVFILRVTKPLTLVTQQLSALSRGEVKKEDIHYTANDEVGKIVRSTKKVVNAIERTIKQANLVADGELDKEIELLSDNDKLGAAINTMIQRLKEIEILATHLSNGNYETKIIPKSSSDKLGLALVEMVTYLDTVTKVSESIAKGEIDVTYKAVGHEDRLGIAMLKMISYLKIILNQANAISKEDFSNTLKVKSHHDELGHAMQTMTAILTENSIKNKEEAYFNEGVGVFSNTLTGIENTNILALEAITMLCRYVTASSGAMYIFDTQTSMLNFTSSFALSTQDNRPLSISLGESIIGQVGLEKKHMLLKGITDDAYRIQSATTQGMAQEVFVFPLVHEGNLFGVVEVMNYSEFTKIKQDYLLKVAGIFATALHVTMQNSQIKLLLEKSQAAFEELQTQSEELQESNVQMEEQQQQLTIQSHELQDKNKTLAIAKEEIDKRADELEKASKYKSEFLANMSHELRTPLNSIILLSKLLSQNTDKTLETKDIEKANVINKSGNDLLFLINDILDLTKIESGKMELNESEVYSSDCVDEMKGLFGLLAEQKNITLEIIDNFNASFITDKSKLSQVLKNLLSNAIKFTSKGSVRLEMLQEEENLHIVVKDTGIGIPEEKIDTIFEAFKQVDGSISREYGGTGLGLSITKTIVDLMHGKIKVHSNLGQGTVFNVVLALKNESHLNKSIMTTLEVPTITKFENLDDNLDFHEELIGKNILIVDDDSRNIFTLTSTLEDNGAEVYSAFNGQEAIEVLETEDVKFDLILMDIMMPVMDGLTAIQKIKSNDNFKDISIIALTAKTAPKDKQMCLDAGADEYLAKPIEFNALFSMIRAWIG